MTSGRAMSVRDDELGAAVSRLAATLLPTESLDSTLGTVAHLTCQTISACDASSISLLGGNGKVVTTAVTNELAAQMDELQYRCGEGPCLEAIRTGQLVRVADLGADKRFPRFSALAAGTEASAALALPLQVEKRSIGALNLYAATTGAFDEGDEAAAERLAMQAAVVVANATAFDQVARLVQQLQTAMESRSEIEQAKGVLMAQSKVGPDEAFSILRQISQQENVKLRDVARRVVSQASTAK
jgi:transcriptional regulator with GAF, ATPase, and Fis domain